MERTQRVAALVDLGQRARAGAFDLIDDALRKVERDDLNGYAGKTLRHGTFATRSHFSFQTTFRNRAAPVFEDGIATSLQWCSDRNRDADLHP